LLDRLESELEDAARVLRRLDEGTYVTCEACGHPIGDDRLAISPVTRRCAEHDPNVAPSSAEG
jgi:RNA polymerase-binding transcription factor DksA